VRLLYVVQRYGAEIAGGAEAHCRAFARQLVGRGHEVEVVTSCARDYASWANAYAAGDELDDNVVVHRLAVTGERDMKFFAPLSDRVLSSRYLAPAHLQERWLHAQGPVLGDLVPWLNANLDRFDVVIFFTYLYYPTPVGVAFVAGRCPVVLHPTAHDEPPFRLPMFRSMMRLVDAFAFSTPEEEALVRTRIGAGPASTVVGVGVDPPRPVPDALARTALGLGDRPYLLCLGRVEALKGSLELAAFFAAYKARQPGPLMLVFAGDRVQTPDPHPDVVLAGVVSDEVKRSLLVGCELLVAPSFYESFSMVLTEAWVYGKATLVQGRCDVLAGQVERTGAGLAYTGFAEFETALDLLRGDAALRGRLGAAGARYVEENYTWDAVMQRYESLLERAAAAL
jgi:glycosyltransferase involved in cell wall biosynthesis